MPLVKTYVPYTVTYNTYYRDQGFYKAPSPICKGTVVICLADHDGTPKAFVNSAMFMASYAIAVEIGHAPCFAITDPTVSDFGDVPEWYRNIWDANMEFGSDDIGNNGVNVWIGVISEDNEVKTGDYCTVVAAVQDNLGLVPPG